jgi:CRISPR-associated endonuclease Cas3-HD
MPDMLSAPKESYQTHIENSLSQWDIVSNRFLPTLSRLFNTDENTVNYSVRRMIFSHDIGKLTERWQKAITDIAEGKKSARPPHSALGAAYLLEWNKTYGINNSLSNASIFAVLIHHIDSGIANESLESPDSQTIQKLFIQGGNKIPWHKEGSETIKSIASKVNISDLINVEEVTLDVLTELSDTLREWSKCPRPLDQHRHRLLASGLHHILKICDWRAAAKRSPDEKEKEMHYSVLEVLSNGGIIP